ncbi:MAG: ABC transporter permease [Pseudomonadota bacterium]
MRLLNRIPSPARALFLGALPFLMVLVAYLIASDMRLAANPDDKLLPSLSSFAEAIQGFALEPNKRTGEYQLWTDTAASLTRLGLGLALSAAIGLLFGVLTGLIPYARVTLSPFIAALSLIPPLALLPVLFIVFGLGEVSKVVLIVIGITPFIMRDLALRVAELPQELLIKAQTLGGSTWQIALRVILPQMLPRLIDAMRLALGAAWLFLIAAEAIAAEDGLGYRIFLVRRYLAMDTILPYVAWITILAFLMDMAMRQISRRLFPWHHVGSART